MLSMKKTVVAIIICLLLSCVFFLNPGQVKASSSFGVKPGDWIEYKVSTTGTPALGHDLIWARMEVVNISGTKMWVNIVAETPNGSLSSAIRDIDFTIGDVEAWIIIPSNLNPGASFYDVLTNSTITIQGQKTETIAGATRTITYVDTPQRHKEWDKATGVYIQTSDYLPGYTVNATAFATNMWAPQILGLDQTMFYVTIIVIAIVIVAALIIAFVRRKASKRMA
jgi:hypothetical protein